MSPKSIRAQFQYGLKLGYEFRQIKIFYSCSVLGLGLDKAMPELGLWQHSKKDLHLLIRYYKLKFHPANEASS